MHTVSKRGDSILSIGALAGVGEDCSHSIGISSSDGDFPWLPEITLQPERFTNKIVANNMIGNENIGLDLICVLRIN